MRKRYRIIIDVTGDAPIVEAEKVTQAEEKFTAGVTAEQLLQLLKIGAEEISEHESSGHSVSEHTFPPRTIYARPYQLFH
jgi:CMP-2-keto-3-deoxyoctulosonic acid synthetase